MLYSNSDIIDFLAKMELRMILKGYYRTALNLRKQRERFYRKQKKLSLKRENNNCLSQLL